MRFHPLLGLGASATPTASGSNSTATGIPGNSPVTSPRFVHLPSKVMRLPFSSFPYQMITPDVALCLAGGGGVVVVRES